MKVDTQVKFSFTDEEKEAFKTVIKCFREIEDSDGMPKFWAENATDALAFIFNLFFTTKDGEDFWQDQIVD